MAQSTTIPHFIVILCGGTGPRLWPVSRANYPKPFLKIFGNQTLLQQTYSRALSIADSKHIYIVTNKKYVTLVKKQVPSAQIISEPHKKNTARAILTATQKISRKHPQAIITSLPSDHYVNSTSSFRQTLKKCYLQAIHGQISLIGITPNRPDISYGYFTTNENFKISQFMEKPNSSVATKLIAKPNTFWNSGIYTFAASTLLSEFEMHQPTYLKTDYTNSPELSIDVAISQQSDNLSYVPANFQWSDVGEWKSIADIAPKDSNGFSKLNQTKYLQLDSSNCLVSTSSSKLIGLVGVSDLAVIDTPDGLLICSLKDDTSYQVRDLVTQIVSHKDTQKYFLKK